MRHTASSPDPAELAENLRLELRRGCLVLAVLAQLRAEHYGYTLRRTLEDAGLPVDEGTLYPLLRRLETQGLLASEWREQDNRNKRFYRLSPAGHAVLERLAGDWSDLNVALDRLVGQRA
jgi:PadR family transcriptional regulator PadR